MKKIMILLNDQGKYPQQLHETQSLDIKMLEKEFNNIGFEIHYMTYNLFLKEIKSISCEDYYFLYASSQYMEYKNYIEDILMYIKSDGGEIVPNFEMFISHENKSFQELYKMKQGIISPAFNLIGTYEEGLEILFETQFPIIAKTPDGFGSKGVVQLKNFQEGRKFLKNVMTTGISLNYKGLRVLARKLKYRNQYPFKYGKVILQEKVNEVNHDWKVLVFGGKCFCLKRNVRKNDFRASGSGNFNYNEEPPREVLEFAIETKNKLNTPWVSLDIITKDKKCFLIEYQALHFGLATLLNNKYYYEINPSSQKWEKKEKDKSTEHYFVQGFIDYTKI